MEKALFIFYLILCIGVQRVDKSPSNTKSLIQLLNETNETKNNESFASKENAFNDKNAKLIQCFMDIDEMK